MVIFNNKKKCIYGKCGFFRKLHKLVIIYLLIIIPNKKKKNDNKKLKEKMNTNSVLYCSSAILCSQLWIRAKDRREKKIIHLNYNIRVEWRYKYSNIYVYMNSIIYNNNNDIDNRYFYFFIFLFQLNDHSPSVHICRHTVFAVYYFLNLCSI